MEDVLSYLRNGDTLVVWRLDRLGRSLQHLIEVVAALAERGIGFKSLTEQIDTTTPGGKLIFHVFGALAEFERDLIRERTHAGLAAARARGRLGGRPKKLADAKQLELARTLYDGADRHRHHLPHPRHLARRRSTAPHASRRELRQWTRRHHHDGCADYGVHASLARLIVRHLRHGLRESLTIAGQIGHPVEAVNAALHEFQAACDGCIVLARPYASEARIVVTVVAWERTHARRRNQRQVVGEGRWRRRPGDADPLTPCRLPNRWMIR